MKKLTYFTLSLLFITASCKSGEESEEQTNTATPEKEEINLADLEKLAGYPCNFISKELVVKYFDVKADELEKNEYSPNKNKISWMDHCTFEWKKENFEEIEAKNQKIVMETMTNQNQNVKEIISKAKSVESAYNKVGVGNLKIFENQEKATTYFNNSHRVPTKEELEMLNKEIDKQGDKKGLTDDQKEMGKSMSEGVASKIAFESVSGLGDIAVWDVYSERLDVLVGTFQFGVIVHTSQGKEANIEKAKAIAKEIIEQL
ncbi:MAG: hypothetical protein R3277_00540 [Brumimicrobium sp.]|nr:hypothetical protein [Brumimicrobium sp.]